MNASVFWDVILYSVEKGTNVLGETAAPLFEIEQILVLF
jgi:hypothetical protein